MEIISGKLYRLKNKSSRPNLVYKYHLNQHGIWTALLQSNRLISVDLSENINATIICIERITTSFGIFLIGSETVGIGTENLEQHE